MPRMTEWLRKLAIVMALCAGPAHAVLLDAPQLSVAGAVDVLEDPAARLGLDDLQRPDVAPGFRPATVQGDAISLGFTGSAYWLRLTLQRGADAPADWLLVLPHAQIDQLTVYLPGQPPQILGSRQPPQAGQYFHRFFVVPVAVGTAPQVVYLRAKSDAALTLPLEVWQPNAFNRHTQQTMVVQGLYAGALLGLMVYNLALCVMLRDRRFLDYALFSVCMGTAMLSGNGLGRLFVWPQAQAFDPVAQSFFLSLALAFAALFTRSFLGETLRRRSLRRLLPVSATLMFGVAAALLASTVWPLPGGLLHQAMVLGTLATATLIVTSSVTALRWGGRSVQLYAASWALILMGGCVATLRTIGWVPTNTVTSYAVQLASAAEMLLLALALAEIVRAERLARTAAQADALDASARLTDNLRHSETRLAQAVHDRTRALEDLLRNQQRVEADQRQMLSLAAHEFRTPAAIIKSSIDSLRWLQPQIPPEVQKRLDNIAQATRRLQRLAQDLIHDERLNQQGIAPQLRPLALGTLLQAWLEDRPVALHIANAPPTLMGDEALLGIAVQNLVDNALRHHPASGPPVQVTLDQISGPGGPSGPSGPLARLRVSDRGPGVPEADRELVFERHFSTQPSQHGAGLGLSIVRRVAQAHQGQVQLAADHQPPGAVFELLLPLQA